MRRLCAERMEKFNERPTTQVCMGGNDFGDADRYLTDDGLAEQGKYFALKEYVPKPLPVLAETKDTLPSPIYDEDPDYIRCSSRYDTRA